MPSITGRVIAGRYSLAEPIGRGAMGVVWRARDLLLDRDVAVKEVVLTTTFDDEERANACQRTLREARTAARLSHRGVVTVYDVAEEDGRPWVVMELVASRSLDNVLFTDGPLTPLRAARIGRQLLAALAAAHAAGVLHRDVKPSNVLIASEGQSDADSDPWDERAVLTDFGIAQFEGDPRLTQTGMVMGSPGFTAPERIRGGMATPASDLWSLGATIYAAVVGRGPYEQRGGPITTMTAIINEDAPVAPSAGALGPVIAALLRREPAARPTAAAAAKMFADVMPLLPDRSAGYVRTVRSPSVPAAPAAPGVHGAPGAGGEAGVEAGATETDADAALPDEVSVPDEAPVPDKVPVTDEALVTNEALVADEISMPDEAPEAPVPAKAAMLAAGSARTADDPVPATPTQRSAPLPPVTPQPVPSFSTAQPAPPASPHQVPSFSAARPTPPADPPTTPQPNFSYEAPHHAPGTTGGGWGQPPAVSRQRRGRRLAIAAAAVVVAAAIGGGSAVLLRNGHHMMSPAASTGTSSLTSLPQSVQAIDTPSSALPSGWSTETVAPSVTGTTAGFTIGVPPGWQVVRKGLATYFYAPDGVRYMDIDLTAHVYQSMTNEARYIETHARAKGRFPGYKRLGIKGVTIRGSAGAFWNFTWDNQRNGTMHVDDLLFIGQTKDGPQSYAIYYTALDRTWSSALKTFDRMLRTFEPLPS
jgi:eukaryotic-like serine/threonine-protein kinase